MKLSSRSTARRHCGLDPWARRRILTAVMTCTLALCGACESGSDGDCPDCGGGGATAGVDGLGGAVEAGGRGGAVKDGGRGGAVDEGGRGGAVEEGGRGGTLSDGGDRGAVDGGNGGAVAAGGFDPGGQAGSCTQGQWILTDEVLNGRDLGATPLENGATVACGKLYRAAALANLTAQGCAEFAQLGIRTVIDLRVAAERATAPEAACVQETANVVLAPLPIPYSVSPEDYIVDLNATESVAVAFTALGDEAAYPVYFHCTYGRDRSGVLAAIVLLALGTAREDVIAEYQLTLEAGLTTYPLSLEAVLDEIDRRGGVEAYLAGAGITSDQLATLRAQAIAP